jgi:hypothetical protein
MIFTKPAQLNGETLIAELKAIGVTISEVIVDGNGNLDLDVKEKDKSKVEEALLVHNGSDTISANVALINSAIAKLQALGLTEDEVAALL